MFYALLRSKSCDTVVHVYDVKMNRNGYPNFLIYIDGQWKYLSAKHFAPLKDEV